MPTSGRDPHQALKTEVVAQHNGAGLQVVLTRLQWGKDDVGYSLHVNPTTYSLSGLQRTDFLAYLGFTASGCAFIAGRRCYVRWVDADFDLERFANAFERAYKLLEGAERGLNACGFVLPQPEGWTHFLGGTRDRGYDGPKPLYGDGHNGMKIERMKQSEDETFAYHFTWIDTGSEKGWVTHYRPKHPPLSSEIMSVFQILRLKQFAECPEFDFEPCFYRSVAFETRDDGFRDSNADQAHRWFDVHATQFTPAIKNLLDANEEIERVGLPFLLKSKPAERMSADIRRRIVFSKEPAATSAVKLSSLSKAVIPATFDVALSFAGADRAYAKELAEALRAAGYAVFYDDYYPEYLWGKNLTAFLDEVYRKKARYCVILISKDYKERAWTSHEFRSAQARALEEKGNDYILPIRIDDTDLDGLPPNLGYLSIDKGTKAIADLLVKKLQGLAK